MLGPALQHLADLVQMLKALVLELTPKPVVPNVVDVPLTGFVPLRDNRQSQFTSDHQVMVSGNCTIRFVDSSAGASTRIISAWTIGSGAGPARIQVPAGTMLEIKTTTAPKIALISPWR